MVQLNYHKEITKKFKSVKHPHVMREFNAAADTLATEALESKTSKVVLSESRKTELSDLDRIQKMIYDSATDSIRVKEAKMRVTEGVIRCVDGRHKAYAGFVQTETQETMAMTRSQSTTQKKHVRFADEQQKLPKNRPRIATAQNEELKWCNLKKVLRGEADKLKYRAALDAGKIADRVILTDDNVLHYMHTSLRNRKDVHEELRLRLVVPTAMVQEVLQNSHDSLKGGHQGIKHDKSCPDRCSSKSRPQFRGYAPGNILAKRPFQIVFMDISFHYQNLSKGTQRCYYFNLPSQQNLCQTRQRCEWHKCSKNAYIEDSERYRSYAMTEILASCERSFNQMIQSRFRATLSYRQANEQQERSVKTVMQSVKQDWDESVEHLVFAINISKDTTRKETPFYLVHGWDAQSTLKAMTTSLGQGKGNNLMR
ncbi:LOW QUALITY PROTEIN: hypothetical protein PHMEG_0007346 [Phytophthora megakarya]|uniref:Reverse transcriptase n=1 Tax=Phytophthora megakarya TaxID=4795 RepID=A0A225WLW6_9STRA|nr:LOW QUALITY PROTEIN: hypothetical protein PHMEG_0007346 [Phytophthora megakarya]